MSKGGGPFNPSRSFMCIRPAMTYAYIILLPQPSRRFCDVLLPTFFCTQLLGNDATIHWLSSSIPA